MVHDDDMIARALAVSNNPMLGRIIAVRKTFTNTED